MSEKDPLPFERAGSEQQQGIVGEFVHFLRHNKKFWLIPILLVLFAMGLIVVLGGTAAAPFIYTMF